jgi:3-oxoadipate enol-lactonase
LTRAVELHVEEYGEGEPSVVLLHGFAGSARNFRPQARFLKPWHRVILFDARGHARSEAPTSASDYSLDAFVDDVERVVARAGSSRVVLGGISMGAAVALRYALRHPDSLAGLVLVSFPPHGVGASSAWALALADAIEQRGADAAGAELVWGGARFDTEAAKWIRQGFLEHAPHALVATLRNALAPLSEERDLENSTRALRVPTLVVVGENDAPSLGVSRSLAGWLPNAELTIVPGAGHVVNLEKPESFNGALKHFLSRI